MAGTKRATATKEYRLREKQFGTRWNKASNTVDDLIDSNPDAARQFTEDVKSAARIIDAAITHMYIYNEDPAYHI